jgi:hypothetical protein
MRGYKCSESALNAVVYVNKARKKRLNDGFRSEVMEILRYPIQRIRVTPSAY